MLCLSLEIRVELLRDWVLVHASGNSTLEFQRSFSQVFSWQAVGAGVKCMPTGSWKGNLWEILPPPPIPHAHCNQQPKTDTFSNFIALYLPSTSSVLAGTTVGYGNSGAFQSPRVLMRKQQQSNEVHTLMQVAGIADSLRLAKLASQSESMIHMTRFRRESAQNFKTQVKNHKSFFTKTATKMDSSLILEWQTIVSFAGCLCHTVICPLQYVRELNIRRLLSVGFPWIQTPHK